MFASLSPRVALLAAILLVAPAPGLGTVAALAGQARALHGSVVRDGEGISSVEVTLHRVTPDSSGVVGLTATDAAGRFSFGLPPVRDSTGFSVYFATVDYLATRYFGAPIHSGEPEEDYAIAVYDTSSAPQFVDQVTMARRDVVMVPANDGGWEVNEVLQIVNPTGVTLVPRGGVATWEFQIPEDVESFQAGEGELGADDVVLMGDRVLLRQPLVPGSRELFLRYLLPAGYAPGALTFNVPLDTLNVFIRQPSPEITVTGAAGTDIVVAEGERFLQYGAVGVGPASPMEVRWAASAPPLVDPVHAAVALTALFLAAGSWAALRNHARAPTAPTGTHGAQRPRAVGG